MVQTGRAVLISTHQYLKDKDIPIHSAAESSAGVILQAVKQQLIHGIAPQCATWLNNEPNLVRVKEQIALAAEQAADWLLVYISGTAVLRRGQFYLALPESTLSQIHINGLSINEIVDIIYEPENAHKVIILDCYFMSEASELNQIIREELHRQAARLKKSFLMAQIWQPNQEAMGYHLARLLQDGVAKQQHNLTLEDIYQEISEIARQQKAPEPLMAAKKQTLSMTIATNQRYAKFKHLTTEAQQAFEAHQFELALQHFLQAQNLYPHDAKTSTHIQFIQRYKEAEQLYAQKQYAAACRAYEAAQDLIPTPLLMEKIERCTADLANYYFETQQYEHARSIYARLVDNYPSDSFYAERLRISTVEHRYQELIDKADHHYFRYEFAEALTAYREALAIHPDPKTERRAQECQRYVDILSHLQQKVEAEVHAKIEAELKQKEVELKQKIESELRQKNEALLAEKLADQQKELSARLEGEITQKLHHHYENLVWNAAKQSNQRAAIELYLTLFPEGTFADQAAQWLASYQETSLAPLQEATVSSPTFVSQQDVLPTYFQPDTQTENTWKTEQTETPQDETELWNQALARNTVEGYMEYISKTIQGDHIADAYYRISQLRSADYYTPQEVQTSQSPNYDTSSSFFYEPLVPELPTENQQNQQNIAEQQEETLWQQAQTADTIQSYQDYLNHSTLLKYATSARQRINELQEKALRQETLDWEKACTEDTVEAYKAYLNKYPFGNFYAKARFRIARLESKFN